MTEVSHTKMLEQFVTSKPNKIFENIYFRQF